ncbi:MAG: hypothetical protein OYH77_03290 [Pseudomonadota bacterium]|nr:hypothetical protein [Pseudomonadota bacterium]
MPSKYQLSRISSAYIRLGAEDGRKDWDYRVSWSAIRTLLISSVLAKGERCAESVARRATNALRKQKVIIYSPNNYR